MKMIDSNRLLRFIEDDINRTEKELNNAVDCVKHLNRKDIPSGWHFSVGSYRGELREAHYIMGLVQAMSEERED